MTITVYRSSDASAPVLTGETGKLNDLLYACLVTGYGAIAGAGWTREYNDATSKTMVFRPGAGPRHYLQSQDNGPGAGSFREARWRGYVSMSAYNTGTEPFPTSTQMTNGLFVRKSNTADTTARNWILVADDKTFHLWIDNAGAAADRIPYTFGAFNSWKSSDAYATLIEARIVENSTGLTNVYSPNGYCDGSTGTSTTGYAPRSYSAVGTAIAIGHRANQAIGNVNGTYGNGTTGIPYPSPIDGGINMSPIYITEAGYVRGTQRGLWNPMHLKPLLDADTFSAVDGATTRDFLAINHQTGGQTFLETSNTWDTP